MHTAARQAILPGGGVARARALGSVTVTSPSMVRSLKRALFPVMASVPTITVRSVPVPAITTELCVISDAGYVPTGTLTGGPVPEKRPTAPEQTGDREDQRAWFTP